MLIFVLIYLFGAITAYFTTPYRRDVPWTSRLTLSILWLPVIGVFTVLHAAEWCKVRF